MEIGVWYLDVMVIIAMIDTLTVTYITDYYRTSYFHHSAEERLGGLNKREHVKRSASVFGRNARTIARPVRASMACMHSRAQGL